MNYKYIANASDNDNFILKLAINCSYINVVKVILKYNRIIYDDRFLHRTAKNGCWEIIELLFNNKYLEYNNKPNIIVAINIAKKFNRQKAKKFDNQLT